MTLRTVRGRPWLLALLLCGTLAAPLAATNGMYLIGYGAETIGRGGANLAIADRSLALNFNPAGIAQLQGDHFTANLSVLAPDLNYRNMANSSVDAQSRYFGMPSLAWVRSGKETRWAYGLGLVAQGGMGASFQNQNTYFGTRDETWSEVRFGTLSPTVAYSLSDDMALGLTLNLGYADTSFRFFPHASYFNAQNPAMSFFGVKMERAKGLQTSARVGWWWRATPRFSVGAIYQTKTHSQYKNGDMTVNFTAHPLLQQPVKYTARMDGFTFAAQAGVGFAYRPADRWVVALDVKRNFWSDAVKVITVKATDPSVAGAPDVTLPFVFNWKDQWVYALGVECRTSDRLTLRAGYNYGENPVPSDTLNPLFPATVEQHATFGFSYLSGPTTWEFALERAFEKTQTNNNPDPMVNPFGPGSRVRHSQWTVSFGASWALERRR